MKEPFAFAVSNLGEALRGIDAFSLYTSSVEEFIEETFLGYLQKEQLQEEQKENEIAKNAKEFLSVLYDNSEKQVIKFSCLMNV